MDRSEGRRKKKKKKRKIVAQSFVDLRLDAYDTSYAYKESLGSGEAEVCNANVITQFILRPG